MCNTTIETILSFVFRGHDKNSTIHREQKKTKQMAQTLTWRTSSIGLMKFHARLKTMIIICQNSENDRKTSSSRSFSYHFYI